MKSTLYLNLRQELFAQIAARTKTIEYRAYTPYWRRWIENREYDVIQFRSGYATRAPEMLVEFRGYRIQGPVKDPRSHGARLGRYKEFAIRLGRILKIKRWRKNK